MPIDSQQQEHFEQNGYLVVRNLIAGDDLAEFDRMIDRLLDGELAPEIAYEGWLPDHFYTFWEPEMKDREDLPRRDRIRLMSNMFHHHPYFKKIGGCAAIHDVAASLFGRGIQMYSDTVFMKPARHGIEAALHQDTAFWPQLEPNAMNFWIAIDPATVENGCLHVVPGTHRVDLPHRDDPVQGHVLDDGQVDASKQIPIELNPGDAIFFDSGLAHRSYPNRSDRSRRAYAAVYGAEDLRHVEPWKSSTIAEKTPDYRFVPIEPPT
jgi:ectoine hydroxylase-related dioxygenase (phytanoyl-CoA dioxygenase family)